LSLPAVLPRIGIFLLVSSLLMACNDNRAVDPGPPAAGEIGSACTTDADCTSDYCLIDPSYQDGYCIQKCDADPSCPEGSTCHDYLGYKFCMDQCGADTDCRNGYVCTYGVCRPPCNSNHVCGQGDTCLNGHCKSKCTADTDCPSGERCQDGKCIPPCKGDGDCLPGFSCDPASGDCKPKQGKSMGEACSSSSQCATAYCLPTRKICSISCTGSGDCPDGYVCGLETFDKDNNGTTDSAEADCVPIKGKAVAGANCTADASCASEHCHYGFCVEACQATTDCQAGLRCVELNILLTGAAPKYKGCLRSAAVGPFYPLGTFPNSLSTYRGFDIPPHAGSFILTTEMNSLSEVPLVGLIKDPTGKTLMTMDSCYQYSQPNRYSPREQFSTLLVPNTTSLKVVPGLYTYTVGSSDGKAVTAKLQIKLGTAAKGTLNLNWFFLNLASTCVKGPTLNAASAKSHAWLGKLRNNVTAILQNAGVKVGSEKFYDLKDPALDVLNLSMTGLSTEMQKLFSSSNKMTGRSINIFFVRDIKASYSGGILGIAGGIPGPPGKHGTVHSGVVLSMKTACYEAYGYNPALALAHELGHYLGLSHNLENSTVPGYSESSNQVICPCPCGANMTCVSQSGKSWCRGQDHIPDTTTSSNNLMFWAAESSQTFAANLLTKGQIRVILNNPVVGF
jgi:hypothetical protein